tara:strand:+ start:36 stop:242 length:207 start_codon:yes stop_codon:yes gene_type:complete
MIPRAKTVFDVLKDRMNEDVSSALQFLGSGGAQDFAQYKEVTGLIRGLRSCIDHVEDLARNQLEDDDD